MILINTKGKCLCTAVGCRLNINSSETTIHYHNITQWRCDPLDTMKHDRRSVSLSFFFIQSLYLPSFSLFIFRPPSFRHRARVGWRRCWEESCCREASCWSEAGMRGAVLLQSPGRNLTDAPIWPPIGHGDVGFFIVVEQPLPPRGIDVTGNGKGIAGSSCEEGLVDPSNTYQFIFSPGTKS